MKIENSEVTRRVETVWKPAGRRYAQFLNRVEQTGLPKTLAVLGCSDGNYVIPAAKRGFEVLAIDADEIALFGGETTIFGEQVELIGLKERVLSEGVESKVNIVHGDCFSYKPLKTYSGVFTSGSIHYDQNAHYNLEDILTKIQNYTSHCGILLIEYIYRDMENNDPRRHFITQEQIASYFPKDGWKITSNKKKRYVEEPNIRNDNIHEISWGRLYAEKK